MKENGTPRRASFQLGGKGFSRRGAETQRPNGLGPRFSRGSNMKVFIEKCLKLSKDLRLFLRGGEWS